MKKIILLLLISVGSLLCQDNLNVNVSEVNNGNTQRKYFSSITVGVIELLSLSFGYQISQSFSLSLKAQNVATNVSLGMITGWGVGTTVAYYYEDELLNSIKLSVIPVFSLSEKAKTNELIKVVFIECAFNHENILADSFRFYYEIGGAVCAWKDRDAFIAPSIKCGLLYNF